MAHGLDAVGLVLARPARMLGLEPFFMELIGGIEESLAAEGRSLLLHVVPDHDAEIRTYRRWGRASSWTPSSWSTSRSRTPGWTCSASSAPRP